MYKSIRISSGSGSGAKATNYIKKKLSKKHKCIKVSLVHWHQLSNAIKPRPVLEECILVSRMRVGLHFLEFSTRSTYWKHLPSIQCMRSVTLEIYSIHSSKTGLATLKLVTKAVSTSAHVSILWRAVTHTSHADYLVRCWPLYYDTLLTYCLNILFTAVLFSFLHTDRAGSVGSVGLGCSVGLGLL